MIRTPSTVPCCHLGFLLSIHLATRNAPEQRSDHVAAAHTMGLAVWRREQQTIVGRVRDVADVENAYASHPRGSGSRHRPPVGGVDTRKQQPEGPIGRCAAAESSNLDSKTCSGTKMAVKIG